MSTNRRKYGSGTLRRRGDKWLGQWRSDGKQVARTLGPIRKAGSKDGLTENQAETLMRKLQQEVKPAPSITEAMTIDELGRRYVKHLERAGRKLSTLTAVRSALKVHLEPFFKDKPVSAITHMEVDDLIATMEKKEVGPKSIRNYIGTLSALYRFAMGPRRRWAAVNPCDGIDLPGVPRHEGIRFLELDQIDALVSNAQPGAYEALDRALYITAAMTGMRLGELIALRWRDVDWTASKIHVRLNYVLGEVGTPKSKRSSRSVPMAPAVGGELDRYFKTNGEPADDALVFADPHTSKYLNKAGVLRRMRKALKAAGLDETHRFHDLRHTFGTQMAKAGTPMRTLMEFMGHNDIQTTQRYADYAPGHQDAELVATAFAREAVTVDGVPVNAG